MLDAIARALQLDDAERAHLVRLAQEANGTGVKSFHHPSSAVSPSRTEACVAVNRAGLSFGWFSVPLGWIRTPTDIDGRTEHMRIKTTIGLGIAGIAAGAAAIGGTAWAAGGPTPAGPAAPVVSEQPGTGAGTDLDCPEKSQPEGSAPAGTAL